MGTEAKRLLFIMKPESWVANHEKRDLGSTVGPSKHKEDWRGRGVSYNKLGFLRTTVAVEKLIEMDWAGYEFVFPSKLTLILKFRQRTFSVNMDAMSGSQSHTHARHPFHEKRKNRELFDSLVTAVSAFREAIPSAQATITWNSLADSIRTEICFDVVRDIVQHSKRF